MRQRRNKGVKEGRIIRKLYRNSVLSIILAAVAAMLGMLIDGIVIGKFLGTESMAAYGLVTPLFSVVTAISGVLASGTQVFCAKHLGAGKIDRARQVFSLCMAVTLAIAIVITGLLFLACEPVCAWLGARGSAAQLLPLAKGYLYGLAPGIYPVLLLFIFNALMRLDGDPNRVVVAVAAMTVCDIVGDLLNALVIHGGMLGMGISTSISYAVALAIMLLHFRKKDILFRFTLRGIQWGDLKNILATGGPSALSSVSYMARNVILNRLLIVVATSTAVAAFSVRNTLNTLFSAILTGVSMTTAMIAGMVYGEEDRTSADQLMKVSLRYAAGIGVLLAIGIAIFSPQLVALFASGKPDSLEMTKVAMRSMRYYVFVLPFYGVNMVMINYLQGTGRLKLANMLTVLNNLVFAVVVALLMSPIMKSDAVWLGCTLTEVLDTLVILLLVYREKKRFPRGTEDLLFLDDDFGVQPEEAFERTLVDMDQTIEASHGIAEFMKAHGASAREQTLVPLFVEEMAGNVIEHGFEKDNKKHSVDLRVFRKNDDWTIRIRDDCVSFDPLERARIFDPADPAGNVGIRMVTGMAKDVQYVNALQLNNLIIKL